MASCSPSASGKLCPTGGSANPCTPFQLSNGASDCFVDSIVTEALQIGAAPINVFKLLGLEAQSNNQDVTGNGVAISGGDLLSFTAANAFQADTTKFRSIQRGDEVVRSAYLGYDFGEFKRLDGGKKYGPETFINKLITSVIITQNCETRKATRIRVERSQDGIKWYGVDVFSTAGGTTRHVIRSSAPSRFWRLRPIEFAGGADDVWEVDSLLLGEFDQDRLDSIQDKVLFENRNRSYALEPIQLKGKFDQQDSIMNLLPHGMDLSENVIIELSFSQCVGLLGRPIVVGDILELPSEQMYTPTLQPVKKYLEVMDVAWSANGYTPGWRPTLLRIVAHPVVASQETQDVLGPIYSTGPDPTGLFDMDDGQFSNKTFQDYSEITQTIRAEAHTEVPLKGTDQSDTRNPTTAELERAQELGVGDNARKLLKPQRGTYVEDAMPPDGQPYTEGDTLPSSGMKNGDYHRLTYTGMAGDIPARLYRYSGSKRRWIYMETDRRYEGRAAAPAAFKYTSPD